MNYYKNQYLTFFNLAEFYWILFSRFFLCQSILANFFVEASRDKKNKNGNPALQCDNCTITYRTNVLKSDFIPSQMR